ncbi:MAG: hypothetical protein ACRDXX_03695 [Stackebrandtia sp.]
MGGVALAYPQVAAAACPGCYGMVDVGEGIYVDDQMTAQERRQAIDVVTEAKHQVGEFFDGRWSDPRVLVCGTPECYGRIGGGEERGVAVMNRALMLSPKGVNTEIASHELSHVELSARLEGAEVPQWFDEGLAVAVSDDPRWLKPVGEADRCRASADEPLPHTLDDWLREASADNLLYAKAACEVVSWMDENGGRPAVGELVRRVASGEEFDQAYQDPLPKR